MTHVTSNLDLAVQRLQDGELVAIPTETVYGLAADIYNERAIKKIFSTKKRPFFDPLIVHVSNIEQVEELVRDVPKSARMLMEKLWPGPLTIVLPKSDKVMDTITAGLPTVGVRMPQHPSALELISKFGHPLAAPSANLFKQTSPTTAQHVLEEFPEEILVLDGGDSQVGLESTVVGLVEERNKVTVEIYRPGVISRQELSDVLSTEFSVEFVKKHNPAAPGQLEDHYMPAKPLVIVPEYSAATVKNLKRQVEAELEVLFSEGIELVLDSHPELVARTLYSQLRELSKKDVSFIYVQKSDYEDEVWDAIWDRLEKAATLNLAE